MPATSFANLLGVAAIAALTRLKQMEYARIPSGF
jgi:hypothetical protein